MTHSDLLILGPICNQLAEIPIYALFVNIKRMNPALILTPSPQ